MFLWVSEPGEVLWKQVKTTRHTHQLLRRRMLIVVGLRMAVKLQSSQPSCREFSLILPDNHPSINLFLIPFYSILHHKSTLFFVWFIGLDRERYKIEKADKIAGF